jgi:hypothetical protein
MVLASTMTRDVDSFDRFVVEVPRSLNPRASAGLRSGKLRPPAYLSKVLGCQGSSTLIVVRELT